MKIEAMAANSSAEFSNGAYRGAHDGYDYQLSTINVGFGIKQYYLTFIMGHSISTLKMKAIKKHIGSMGLLFSSVITNNNTISIFIKNIEKTMLRMRKLVQFLKTEDMQTISSEIYGSNAEVTSYKTIRIKIQQRLEYNIVIPVNDEIYKQAHEQLVQQVNLEGKDNVHTVGGIIFAILGAIIGSVPSVIAYELGFMSWWLYFLVPLASFYSYIYAKGPQHRFVPLVIAFITIFVSVLVFLYTWLSFASINDYTLAELLKEEGIFNGFLSDGLFLVIGNLVGVAFSYKYIYSRTIAGKLKDLEGTK